MLKLGAGVLAHLLTPGGCTLAKRCSLSVGGGGALLIIHLQVVIVLEVISWKFALGLIPAAAFSSVLGCLLSSGPWLHPFQAGLLSSVEKQPLCAPALFGHCCVTPCFMRVFILYVHR